MRTIRTPKRGRSAFSLVEILVVIAVIGIITAIAIPALSEIFSDAKTRKNERNAQIATAVYALATSAGAVLPTADPVLAINALREGVTITDPENPLNLKSFTLSMDTDDISPAASLLTFQGGLLVVR
jgi:prepilin-type N-terminal cleavage/methylation domain-containing protein